mmetsp:Transcript_78539/g.230389  ORF Transcript_78539/g.230389 Transcript_78539/m.230389 type:complete len:229 (-) Transcript_78539:217-903(-)
MGCGASRTTVAIDWWTSKDAVFELTEEFYTINSSYTGSSEPLIAAMPAGRHDKLSGGLSSNILLRFNRGDKTVADHEYECIFPTPEGKPQDYYKCPPVAMDVEAEWHWMRDDNDKEKNNPLEGYILLKLERWGADGERTTIWEAKLGPCGEISDEQHIADEGWTTTTQSWSLAAGDQCVTDIKDGDVFSFRYMVGTQGCKAKFKRFRFNIQWQKSAELLKEEAELAKQ